MYAAAAARAALRPLLYKHDVGGADSFEEKAAGPADLTDQRVAIDLQLVDVSFRTRVLVNDAQQNLIAIERICTGRRLCWITVAIDRLIERHRKMTVLA